MEHVEAIYGAVRPGTLMFHPEVNAIFKASESISRSGTPAYKRVPWFCTPSQISTRKVS
jgi:hypothetical protein